jgi:glucosyl-3-phosphoglycerate synthase
VTSQTRPTIAVVLPARNEAETVGAIVHAIRRDLPELVDDVLVVDDGSVDGTGELAVAAGARVTTSPGGPGKGQAMRAGIRATDADVIVFCDADLYEFESHFVSRLVEPLIGRDTVKFVKAVYRRPLGDRPDEGGRVTELVARPMLSLLFPELEHIVQPLGGEYAGRRDVFESIPFDDGYGVDVGLLIDVAERCGVEAIAQVDLGVRLHRNRPLRQLVPQARAVMAAVLARAGERSPTVLTPRGTLHSD